MCTKFTRNLRRTHLLSSPDAVYLKSDVDYTELQEVHALNIITWPLVCARVITPLQARAVQARSLSSCSRCPENDDAALLLMSAVSLCQPTSTSGGSATEAVSTLVSACAGFVGVLSSLTRSLQALSSSVGKMTFHR